MAVGIVGTTDAPRRRSASLWFGRSLNITLLIVLCVLDRANAFCPGHGPRPIGRQTDDRPIGSYSSRRDAVVRRSKQAVYLQALLESTDEQAAPDLRPTTTTDRKLRLLVLATVPFVWGTYVPVVRSMYELSPPVPGLLFSTCYLLVASAVSLLLLGITGDMDLQDEDESTEEVATPDRVPTMAGFELGTYTFLANSMQVIGLKTVESDRAGFLIQLTTIFVPIVQAILDGNISTVSNRTWVACSIALSGVAVMGVNDQGVEGLSLATFQTDFSQGDAFIVGAAFLYTLHVVRLGYWADQTTPLRLSSSKAVVQSLFSTTLVLGLALLATSDSTSALLESAKASGREIIDFVDEFKHNLVSDEYSPLTLAKIAGALVWSGAIGTAYVLYAQSFGQRTVTPSEANLVYSLQPLFTAFFAFLLLGETMESTGYVGGGLILGAVYIVASTQHWEDRIE